MSDTAVHPAHSAHPPGFAHQFEDVEQQREAGRLGMWLFLVTEILFFGGMFTAYIVYRSLHFQAFEIGSHLLELQVRRHEHGRPDLQQLDDGAGHPLRANGQKQKAPIIFWLVITMILGAAFIGIKLRFEWYRDYVEHIVPGVGFHNPAGMGRDAAEVQMFMCFYFFMTGLHALHMVIGLGILTVLVIMTAQGQVFAGILRAARISAACTGTLWILCGFSCSRFYT